MRLESNGISETGIGFVRSCGEQGGVLGRRQCVVESVQCDCFREVGDRVDRGEGGRRIEIVVDGSVMDATFVSPLHCDGSPVCGPDVFSAEFWSTSRR